MESERPGNRALSISTVMNARVWARNLARYRLPSLGRSIVEILITVVPFLALWTSMWAVLDIGYWLSLLLALPAAGFLVRLFMIQHDCGHGAFFRHRVANDWIGRVIGVLTLTPYDFWRRTHAIHHATSGNLEHRGIGDVDTLTVNEYLARSRWGRLRYRLYRHPIVMFGLGPAYLFILQYRLPFGLLRAGWQPWLSTMGTNRAIAIRVSIVLVLGSQFESVFPALIHRSPRSSPDFPARAPEERGIATVAVIMDAGPPGALPNGRQDRFRREWMLGQLHPEGFRASSIVETMEAMFVPYQCEGHRRRYSCEACGPRRKAMRMKTPSLPSLAKSNFDQPGAMRVS